MTAIAGLAERLLATREPGGLPPTVLEAARQRLFDSLACFEVGAARDEGRLMRTLTDLSCLDDRIRYACAATRCTELDDIHIESCTTPGSIAAPVAVLVAASRDVEDRQVLGALVAGYQAMTSLGRAVDGVHCVYEGIWPTYLTAPFGAAAVGAGLLGLDTERTAHALAIAATRCVGTTGQMPAHATSRWFTVGCAASEGYRAAAAAALGIVGDAAVLERGFGRATGVRFDPDSFEDPEWSIVHIDTKPFRVGRQALSAVEAYRALGVDPHADHIQVFLPAQVLGMLDHPEPPGQRLRLGLQFQLAALTFQETAAREAFMSRVRLTADDRLSALYPHQWGARVEITAADGSTRRQEVLDPGGSARKPFGWPELLQKHRQAAGDSAEHLERLYDLCRAFGRDPQGQHTVSALLEAVGLA